MEPRLPGAQCAWRNQGENSRISITNQQLLIGKHHLSQGGGQVINEDHGQCVVNHPCHRARLAVLLCPVKTSC